MHFVYQLFERHRHPDEPHMSSSVDYFLNTESIEEREATFLFLMGRALLSVQVTPIVHLFKVMISFCLAISTFHHGYLLDLYCLPSL